MASGAKAWRGGWRLTALAATRAVWEMWVMWMRRGRCGLDRTGGLGFRAEGLLFVVGLRISGLGLKNCWRRRGNWEVRGGSRVGGRGGAGKLLALPDLDCVPRM